MAAGYLGTPPATFCTAEDQLLNLYPAHYISVHFLSIKVSVSSFVLYDEFCKTILKLQQILFCRQLLKQALIWMQLDVFFHANIME